MKFFFYMLTGFIVIAADVPCLATTFHDALGRTINLESPPRRIVTLAPSLTEIIFCLGLGDRLVGVTTFSDYPPEAAQKPKVGTYVNLNVEKIIDLAPDFAIGTADGNSRRIIGLLDQAGIPVYVVNPRNIRGVIDTIASLGKPLGVWDRASELSNLLTAQVNDVVQKVGGLKRTLVFLQINVKPIMTVNRHTLHNDLIRLAGGKNMAEDEPVTYPRISIEEVIRKGPEVIIISSMERGGSFEDARKEWMKWPNIPAVRDGRVYLVDSDLLDRSSPRIIEGLKTVAELIHPEAGWNN